MKLQAIAAAFCAAALLSFSGAQAATKISDPLAFVKSVYATVKSGKAAPDDINTPRLQALYDLDRREAGGEVGRIDFDIWMNAQDGTISDVNVKTVPVENGAGREVVIAAFKNEGKPQEVHFYFEMSKAGWLLDDAQSVLGERWTLSLILKYGWDGKN
jgi:ADP-dependent phosphofructokinase/glucokinase